MKILVQAVPQNHLFGFKALFEAKKHKWIWWDDNHTPAFDVFEEVQPDLYIGCEPVGQISRAVSKCLGRYKPKTIFQIAPYTYEIGKAQLSYPVLVNTSVHQPGDADPALACDIACCEEPHPHLLSLCKGTNLNIKILGEHRWPVPQYLGGARWDELVRLYQSAKIGYANTMEEIGRIMACRTLCITSNADAQQVFGEAVWPVLDAFELYDDCSRLLTSCNGECLSRAVAGHRFIHDQQLTYDRAFHEVCESLSKEGCRV